MTNQRLYLIPTTPSYEYEPYDHIYLVKASIELNKKSHSIHKISSNKLPKIQYQNHSKHQ